MVEQMIDPSTVSEDCLTINVFRPSGASSEKKLPVVRGFKP